MRVTQDAVGVRKKKVTDANYVTFLGNELNASGKAVWARRWVRACIDGTSWRARRDSGRHRQGIGLAQEENGQRREKRKLTGRTCSFKVKVHAAARVHRQACHRAL